MKRINITCTNSKDCHITIKTRYPACIAISHIPNDHIVTFPEDYTNGRLDPDIHLFCWQIGGIIKRRNGKIRNPPSKTTNPYNSQRRELL